MIVHLSKWRIWGTVDLAEASFHRKGIRALSNCLYTIDQCFFPRQGPTGSTLFLKTSLLEFYGSDLTELFWNSNVASCLTSLNGFTWLLKGRTGSADFW